MSGRSKQTPPSTERPMVRVVKELKGKTFVRDSGHWDKPATRGELTQLVGKVAIAVNHLGIAIDHLKDGRIDEAGEEVGKAGDQTAMLTSDLFKYVMAPKSGAEND